MLRWIVTGTIDCLLTMATSTTSRQIAPTPVDARGVSLRSARAADAPLERAGIPRHLEVLERLREGVVRGGDLDLRGLAPRASVARQIVGVHPIAVRLSPEDAGVFEARRLPADACIVHKWAIPLRPRHLIAVD